MSIVVRNIIFYGLLINSKAPFLRDFFALEFPEEFRKQIPAYKDDMRFIELTEVLLPKGESRETAFLLLARSDCLPMLNFEFHLHQIRSVLFAEQPTFESILDPIDAFAAVKLFKAQELNSMQTDEVLNGILSSIPSTVKALVLDADFEIIFADCAPLDGTSAD
jgi:hypothetical protein